MKALTSTAETSKLSFISSAFFNVILNSILFLDSTEKPQTLLFSATLPPWVQKTAEKYMSEDKKIVDLIGDQELKASETIQVLFAKLNLQALIL